MTMSNAGQIEADHNELELAYKGTVYLRAKHPLFRPHFQNEPPGAAPRVRIVRSRQGLTLHYAFSSGLLASLQVTCAWRADHFEIGAQAVPRKAAALSHWDVFGGPATTLGVNQLVVAHPNPLGQLTTGVFDKLRMTRDDSYTQIAHRMGCGVGSWFFPVPVNYILGAYHELLFLGLEETCDHSQWQINVSGQAVQSWRLTYGNHLRYAPGQPIQGPRWLGFFMDTDNALAPWPVYTKLLEKKGRIKVKKHRRATPAWWRDLTYVTWGDQHVLANGRRTVRYQDTETNLSDETVARWTGLIKKHNLPLRTMILDGYWARQIGDWVADPARFADMRRLVDGLHARGWHVLFWFCPFEAERTAPVFRQRPDLFLKERKNQQLFLELEQAVEARPRFDYTNPEARAILRETIRRVMSPEPGCYNGDGFKLDFYGSAPDAECIEKFHDPSWGLGYRYILKTHQAIVQWAKEFKPDCRIDGECGNPFFTDTQDTLRAWDWCEPDYTVYNDRVKLASVLCPGIPAIYDEHIHFRNLYKFCLRGAVARPLFFNVQTFHGDMHTLTAAEYRDWSAILHVVADLNRRARDVTPQSLEDGAVYDQSGKLIGKVAKDDTALICEREGVFTVVLLNDGPRRCARGVVVDPVEFGRRGAPFAVQARIPAGRVAVVRRRSGN